MYHSEDAISERRAVLSSHFPHLKTQVSAAVVCCWRNEPQIKRYSAVFSPEK